jgi:hypothetical protein
MLLSKRADYEACTCVFYNYNTLPKHQFRYNSRPSRKQIFSYNSNHPAFDELPRTYNYRNADFDPNYWESDNYFPAEQQNNAPDLDAEFTNVAFNQHLRGMQSWGTDSFNSYEGLPHIYSHAYMDANINASRKIFSSAQPFGFSNLRYNGNNIATNSGISFDILSEFSSASWHGFKDNIWHDLAISVADSIALPCKILSLPGIFIDHHELNYPWSDFSDNERQYINQSYADVVSTYDNTKKFIISQANFLAPRNITDSLLFSSLPTYILYRYSEPMIKYMPAAINEIKSNPSGAGYVFGSGFSKVASALATPYAIGAGYKVINVSTKALVYASTKGAPILFGGMKKLGGLPKNAFKKYAQGNGANLAKNNLLFSQAAQMDLVAIGHYLDGKPFPYSLMHFTEYMGKRGVDVLPLNMSPSKRFPGFQACNPYTRRPAIYLPDNPTVLEVKHELSHWLDYKRLGVEKYSQLSPLEKEQMVLDRLKQNRV